MKSKVGTTLIRCLRYKDLKELLPASISVERTLYLVCKVDPDLTKEAVQMIVKLYTRCQSIDTSDTHDLWKIQVTTKWMRLARDVIHY